MNECRPLQMVLTVCMFIICIPMLAAGSSIQHVADEPVCTYDGIYFQPGFTNDSTYFKPAPNDLPTMPTQYQSNHATKSTKPVSDVPRHEYTYKGENHSNSEGDDSNQRHFLFIDYKLYFPPILKKKRRRRKKSRKPGTRKKEVATKQDQSSNEKGTEQHNSCDQTPTGTDSQVHSPVMEESVQLSISIYRGGNSKSDVMVTPSQKPKAQADKDKDESEQPPTGNDSKVHSPVMEESVQLSISIYRGGNSKSDVVVTPSQEPKAQADKDKETSSEEPDIRPWVDSVKAVNTCAVDELVAPKLQIVVGTHIFNGSVIHENNVATEDICMGSVIKPVVELGPPPEKELCGYCTLWYANAVPTA